MHFECHPLSKETKICWPQQMNLFLPDRRRKFINPAAHREMRSAPFLLLRKYIMRKSTGRGAEIYKRVYFFPLPSFFSERSWLCCFSDPQHQRQVEEFIDVEEVEESPPCVLTSLACQEWSAWNQNQPSTQYAPLDLTHKVRFLLLALYLLTLFAGKWIGFISDRFCYHFLF